MDKHSKERRQHTRINRNFILTYHEIGASKIKHNISQVNNVSKGGMSFSASHPLKHGTGIRINLKTPIFPNPIHLEGTVLESREKIPEIIYEIRLQFKEIPEKVLTILEKIMLYGKTKEG